MVSDLQLVDSGGNVLVDLQDVTGAANPFGLKVTLRAIDFGERNREAGLFSPPDLPEGGTRTRLRHGLRVGQMVLKVQADSTDNFYAGLGELDRLLELDGVALRFSVNGQTRARTVDLVDAFSAQLLRGEALDGPFKVDHHLDITLGVTFTHQPFARLPDLDSDTNRLRNPSMILLQRGASAGIPAHWELADTFDNNVILGEPTYFSDNDGGGWEVETDPAQVPGHIIQQRIAAEEGETVTFAIEAMRVAGAGTYAYELACLDAAGAMIGGSSVSTAQLSDAAFTRRTLTKANLPAGTVEAIVVLHAAGGAATLRYRKAKLETGAVATDFVASSEEIPANPEGPTAVPAPTVAPVAANAFNTPGSVNGGTHGYVYTNVDAEGNESLPSPISNIVTVDGASGTGGNQDGKVNLSGILPGGPGTVARRIHRTVAGNTGVHKFVAEIADNTTTTFLDNVADASLGTNVPTVAPPPPGEPYPGRVLLIYNPGEARSPVRFRVTADEAGMLQAIQFGIRSFGGDKASLLGHFVNGPLVFQGEDSLIGADDHSVGTSASYLVTADGDASGGLAFDANPSSNWKRIQRFVYDDIDVLEAFRGPLRVALRCRNTDKSHRLVQMRWGDSMESPAVHVPPPYAHNTDIDGLATFGYVLVDLGTISIAEEGTLEGLTIEVWTKDIVSPGGNLFCDCVLLSPIEQSSLVSLPYVAKAQIAGEGAGTPISLGSNLGNNQWRPTWRYSIQAPSNGPDYTIAFRVRRDNGTSGPIVAEIQHETDTPVTNVTTQLEFESLEGVEYFTSRSVIAGTGTLTIHDITVGQVCTAHEGETIVTNPNIGEDRAYVENMDGRFMCEAFPSGPTPFWVEPGWSAVTIDPFEPRIGGLYAELKHDIRRRPVVGHTILGPRVRQP